ncbi:MAG: hypothetical protein ACFFDY_09055 [Candidatus Thorarchaeota archaeon]
MDLEDIILVIIKDSGLSRNEIHDLIRLQKSEINKKISDKKALLLIAKSLCINI